MATYPGSVSSSILCRVSMFRTLEFEKRLVGDADLAKHDRHHLNIAGIIMTGFEQ